MSNQIINAMTLKSSAIYNQNSLRDALLNPTYNHIILKKIEIPKAYADFIQPEKLRP